MRCRSASADSKNDTTKCEGMSDTSERNGSKLSTLCELTIEAGELEKALLDKVYGQAACSQYLCNWVFSGEIIVDDRPIQAKTCGFFFVCRCTGCRQKDIAVRPPLAAAQQSPFADTRCTDKQKRSRRFSPGWVCHRQ